MTTIRKHRQSVSTRKRHRNRGHAARLAVEPLEDRRLLAVVEVNTVSDVVDFGGSQMIADLPGADGEISLREAIIATNNTAGFDHIQFDALGTFRNSTSISLTGGELKVTDSVLVDGPGPDFVTVDAAGASRVFNIDDGSSFDIAVELRGLRLTGGNEASGGGVYNNEFLEVSASQISGNFATFGGGVYNNRTLSITDTAVDFNSADNDGGGIHNAGGTLVVERSTISDNLSGDDGGGIWTDTDLAGAISIVRNSTISGNQAISDGGGIYNFDGHTDITLSTITNNLATMGSGVGSFGDAVTLTTVLSSIISGNVTNDVDVISGGVNSFQSGGYNLIGYGTGASYFNSPSDQIYNGDPRLGHLSYNGGPTRTHALDISSPAIDAGVNLLGLVHDQRGAPFLRTDPGFPTDIGAYEWQTAWFPLLVDTADDERDEDYSAGDLSLREAINASNGFIGGNVIEFDTGGVFSILQTIPLSLGQLNIRDEVSVLGPGASRLTIDARERSRVISIDNGVPLSQIDVFIEGVTLYRGLIDNAFDGGAGIRNFENLTLVNSVVDQSFSDGDYTRGIGIYSSGGNLTISGCAIINNEVLGASPFGAGIYSDTDLTGTQTTIVNSTISGNRILATDGGGGGAGLMIYDGLTVIQNSTISDNEAFASHGSGVASYGDVLTRTEVVSTIIADNTGSDVEFISGSSNSFQSNGHNLIGSGNAISAFGNNDQTNVSASLGPLWSHGGPTPTHSLLAGSLAIDQGIDPVGLSFDQRGVPFQRNVGGVVDVGAYERQIVPVSLVVDTIIDELDGDLGPGDLSLREAIDVANGSPGVDTIRFDEAGIFATPQTIGLMLGELPVTDSLVLEGPGLERLTVDAQQHSRVFYIYDGDRDYLNRDNSLSGLTITGGHVSDTNLGGGGILSRDITTIRDVAVIGNTTSGPCAHGGGIEATANFSALESTIADNHTLDLTCAGGGGITSSADILTISHSTITGNSTVAGGSYSGVGGGLQIFGETAVISYTTISNNSTHGAFAKGGGIFSHTLDVAIFYSTISGNRTTGADAHGGGIYHYVQTNYSGSLEIRNSTISGNSTEGLGSHGGGVFSSGSLGSSGTTSIVSSTLSGNATNGIGGGLFNYDGLARIEHSTISENLAAPGLGSGVASTGDAFTRTEVLSSIVAGNSPGDVEFLLGTTNSFHSLGYNLIGTGNSVTAFSNND